MNSPRSTLGTTRRIAYSYAAGAGTQRLLDEGRRRIASGQQVRDVGGAVLLVGRERRGRIEPIVGDRADDPLDEVRGEKGRQAGGDFWQRARLGEKDVPLDQRERGTAVREVIVPGVLDV